MSIENLLSALQRGTVPGADGNVAFLCQKYTALLERLRIAEDGERSLEEHCANLDMDLRTEEAQERAEREELEASGIVAKEDVAKLEASLAEARSEEAAAQQDLISARAEAEDCQQRRMALDEQCASERSRLAEVNSRFRQMQITRPVGHTELRRLQNQLQALTVQYHSAAEELTAHRERASRETAALSELKAEALSEEESRDRASEVAAKHREELSEALGELSLLKERLAEAQVGVQRCEDELERRAERRLALQAEIQKYDIWLSNASREMEDLHEVDRSLARVHADSVEVRSSLNLEEAEVRSAEAARDLKEKAMAEAGRHFLERTERLEAVELQHEAVLLEVNQAEAEQSQLEAVIEQLRHDQTAGGGLHRNLEQETQLLLSEAERLRHERDSRLADRGEMLQRLRLLTPALTEARRRVRELEDSLEAMRAEASRERSLAERLEREAGACQDKMRVLRDQNVRLAEKCTEVESQLASTSSRMHEASRARSTSACGRGHTDFTAERLRPSGRGQSISACSSARGRAATPLGSRPSTPLGSRPPTPLGSRPPSRGLGRDHVAVERDLEDPSMHDVVLSASSQWVPAATPHQWVPAVPSSTNSQPPPHYATEVVESRPEVFVLDTPVLTDFNAEGGVNGRDAAPRNLDLQILKDWVEREDDRLGGIGRPNAA